jgi:hypothetical protein
LIQDFQYVLDTNDHFKSEPEPPNLRPSSKRIPV